MCDVSEEEVHCNEGQERNGLIYLVISMLLLFLAQTAEESTLVMPSLLVYQRMTKIWTDPGMKDPGTSTNMGILTLFASRLCFLLCWLHSPARWERWPQQLQLNVAFISCNPEGEMVFLTRTLEQGFCFICLDYTFIPGLIIVSQEISLDWIGQERYLPACLEENHSHRNAWKEGEVKNQWRLIALVL